MSSTGSLSSITRLECMGERQDGHVGPGPENAVYDTMVQQIYNCRQMPKRTEKLYHMSIKRSEKQNTTILDQDHQK